MSLVVVGVHQNSMPVALRERLSISPEEIVPVLARLSAGVASACIVSTCNRVEIYAWLDRSDQNSIALATFLAQNRGVPLDEIQPYLYTWYGKEAVAHLFRVTAGLNSMVLGEDQILSQVKDALEFARQAGTLNLPLSRLGEAALATGKRVRTNTALNRSNISIVSVGLQLAFQALGTPQQQNVLILGAGRIATLVLEHLSKSIPKHCIVVNRTFETARSLATKYGVHAEPVQNIIPAIAGSTLIVSCTGAPALIVDAAMVRQAQELHSCQRVFLDLAVPRDIEPATADIDGITLYDVDSLGAICTQNRQQRRQEIAHAEAIVMQVTDHYMDWLQSRHAVPAISALRRHAESIRDTELARAMDRLAGSGLSERDKAIIHSLAAGIVNKLLHHPVSALKSSSQVDLVQATQVLFGLDIQPQLFTSPTLQIDEQTCSSDGEPSGMFPDAASSSAA